VLASEQPGPVAELAVAKFGAAGIVSYAQSQRTAWWGDDDTLVRWGHLETFAPYSTFAFMIAPGTARRLQQRLAAGEEILLQAAVEAGRPVFEYFVALEEVGILQRATGR
jgi:aminopeptidase YwaD